MKQKDLDIFKNLPDFNNLKVKEINMEYGFLLQNIYKYEFDELNRVVKQYCITLYDNSNINLDEDEIVKLIITNTNNNPDISYALNTINYDYIDNTNKISRIIRKYMDTTIDTVLFIYDNMYRLIEYKKFIRNTLYIKKTFKYDDDNNIIEMNYYNKDENIQATEKFEYTKNGLERKIIKTTDFRNTYISKEYDDKNNIIKMIDRQTGPYQENKHTITYEYTYGYNSKAKYIHKHEEDILNYYDVGLNNKYFIIDTYDLYDDNGNNISTKIIEFNKTTNKLDTISIKQRSFNSENKLLKVSILRSNLNPSEYSITNYDNNDINVYDEYNYNDNSYIVRTFNIRPNNDVLLEEEKIYDNKTNLLLNRKSYDENGNIESEYTTKYMNYEDN